MHGAMTAGAEHGEVLRLGFADSASQGYAVMGLDQVETGVFLPWDGPASLADDVSCLGALAGELLSELGRLGVAFHSEVGLEDLAPFTVLQVLRSVLVALASARG